MKKKLHFLWLLVLMACNSTQTTVPNAGFDTLLEDYYQQSLKLYRINATFLGDDRYNDTLPNFLSSEFEAKEKSFLQHYSKALSKFEENELTSDHWLSK